MDADPPNPSPTPEVRRRRLWPTWGPRAVFESFLIVFSVILAMAVTNWAEDRKTAQKVEEAKAYFVAEIAHNRRLLANDAYLPHHQRLQTQFNQAMMIERPTLGQAMPAFRAMFSTGIHVAPLRDAVWRSASSSDLLSEMPLTEVFMLSDIYRQQDQLGRMSETFIAGMPDVLGGLEDGTGVKAALTAVVLHLGDVTSSEQGLIRQYDAALARLDPDGTLRRKAATPTPGDGRAVTR